MWAGASLYDLGSLVGPRTNNLEPSCKARRGAPPKAISASLQQRRFTSQEHVVYTGTRKGMHAHTNISRLTDGRTAHTRTHAHAPRIHARRHTHTQAVQLIAAATIAYYQEQRKGDEATDTNVLLLLKPPHEMPCELRIVHDD